MQIQIPHDQEENRAISKIATAFEDDNNILALGNQDEDNAVSTLCGNLYNDEVVANSVSVTTTMKHNGIGTIYKEEGIAEKNITAWNLEDNFATENKPEEHYGNLDFTGLQSSLSDHHYIGNEEIQRKTVKEILEEDKVNNVEGLGLHFDAHVKILTGSHNMFCNTMFVLDWVSYGNISDTHDILIHIINHDSISHCTLRTGRNSGCKGH
ncbi:hypothetical protein ACJX0J_017987 [Zea mays]